VTYLEELYLHQEWADAEHWRAFESFPRALEDKAIRERLFHIHLVQHAFLWVTGPQTSEFDLKKVEDFPSMSSLHNYAREGLAQLREFVKGVGPSEEGIEVPWFKPPAKISIRQALMQAAMHSHYHRGQNATRLRELGGVPPMTDFIVWLHKGEPAAQWD
jgi:uncharacterized damage-inducible protein DinB